MAAGAAAPAGTAGKRAASEADAVGSRGRKSFAVGAEGEGNVGRPARGNHQASARHVRTSRKHPAIPQSSTPKRHVEQRLGSTDRCWLQFDPCTRIGDGRNALKGVPGEGLRWSREGDGGRAEGESVWWRRGDSVRRGRSESRSAEQVLFVRARVIPPETGADPVEAPRRQMAECLCVVMARAESCRVEQSPRARRHACESV